MKIFHLADLHIGKKVNMRSMLDEQKVILDEVLVAVDTEEPDVIILAGDIYDRRNPGIEAVNLLDSFLSDLVLRRRIPVLAIGGNHDSGERLAFAGGILSRAGLHLVGVLRLPVPQVVLEDDFGKVTFHLLPYADLANLRYLAVADSSEDYATAMNRLLDGITLEAESRHVLIAHGVVFAPGEELMASDSERELSIGGTEYWSHQALLRFDYVALGHLHRAQRAGADHIRYAGSPLKYSFSEENHVKAIQIVQLDGEGFVNVRSWPLRPLHEMRTIRGKLADLLAKVPTEGSQDYLRVILEDKGEVLDPMARLRVVYPNIMALERAHPFALGGERPEVFKKREKRRTPYEQLQHFYHSLTGECASDGLSDLMKKLLLEAEEEIR